MQIDPVVFFVAFAVGLFYCYVSVPPPEVVYKFPNPNNAGQVVYRTERDGCYKYRADRVDCPADAALIRPQSDAR